MEASRSAAYCILAPGAAPSIAAAEPVEPLPLPLAQGGRCVSVTRDVA